MADLSDIYSDRILTLAAGITRVARLSAPTATASAHSKMCGSTIAVDLIVANGRVLDFGQSIKACLLGQAAAAVMAQQIIGTTPDEIRRVGETMRAMLKRNGPPPTGRWADLAALEPVREAKGRHASTLLVFDAVERALAETSATPEVELAAKSPVG